jgi:hypothetical protein
MWPTTELVCVPKASGPDPCQYFVDSVQQGNGLIIARARCQATYLQRNQPAQHSSGSVWQAAMACQEGRTHSPAHPPELHRNAIRSRCPIRMHQGVEHCLHCHRGKACGPRVQCCGASELCVGILLLSILASNVYLWATIRGFAFSVTSSCT